MKNYKMCTYKRSYLFVFGFWCQWLVLLFSSYFRPSFSQSVQVAVQKQICLQRGSPNTVGGINKCSFHGWTLEDKFQLHVCEPSGDWLQGFITLESIAPAIDLCQNLTTENCDVDNEICSSDNETIAGKDNEHNCFIPPLLVLQSLLDALLPTYPELDHYALKLPSICLQKGDPTSCSQEPGCDWKGTETQGPTGSAPTPTTLSPTVGAGANKSSSTPGEADNEIGIVSTNCVVNNTFQQQKNFRAWRWNWSIDCFN
mmetsp:Transcript_1169/g.1547  ORF Transcript_1169/g.1547 Transcript_1169/m.1547 type:complete len:257 (-) Transcript_1169:2617-3387(-)